MAKYIPQEVKIETIKKARHSLSLNTKAVIKNKIEDFRLGPCVKIQVEVKTKD